jgi:hypothetical protein
MRFLSRTTLGVTSMISSAATHPMASSSVMRRGGDSFTCGYTPLPSMYVLQHTPSRRPAATLYLSPILMLSTHTPQTGEAGTCSSEPLLRTLDSFFSLHGLTMRSSALECSPTIMPSYTSVPGSTNKMPRGSRAISE